MRSLWQSVKRHFPKSLRETWPGYIRRRAEAVSDIRGTEGLAAILDIIEADAQNAYMRLRTAPTPEASWEARIRLDAIETIWKRLTTEVDEHIEDLSRERFEGLRPEFQQAGQDAIQRQQAHRSRVPTTNGA